MTVVVISAVVPAVATIYFAAFWLGFAWWRRHPLATYAWMLGSLAAAITAAVVWRDALGASGVAPPAAVQAVGWALIAAALGLGVVADRQLGVRVRAFVPFFDDHERIALRTTGAYAVVRHPIYAAGLYYQLGALLVTGRAAVAIALGVLAGGAAWFTRQEERRLCERLDDPAAYAAYRARVGALVPRLGPRPVR